MSLLHIVLICWSIALLILLAPFLEMLWRALTFAGYREAVLQATEHLREEDWAKYPHLEDEVRHICRRRARWRYAIGGPR